MKTLTSTDLVSLPSSRARNAYRVAIMFFVVITLTVPVYFYLAWQTQAWQLFVVAGAVAALDLTMAAGAVLSRRNRSELGIGLILGALSIVGIIASALLAGLGLPLGLILILISVQVATQTLSQRWAFRAIVAVIGTTLIMGLLDLLATDTQLAVPILLPIVLIAAGVLVTTFSVVIFRQFQSYALRTKLLLILLLATLVPMSLLAFLTDRTARVELTATAERTLLTGAQQTADLLDDFIESTVNTVKFQSQLPLWAQYLSLPADQRAGSEVEAEVRSTLRILSNQSKIGSYSPPPYALLDRQGIDVIDTSAAEIGQNRSDEEYFRQAIDTLQSYVSPVIFAQAVGGAAVYFSSPIWNEAGEIVGVLRASYPAGVLQELVERQNGAAGEQSFAALFDENYIHLAHGTAPSTLFKLVGLADEARIADLQAARRLRPAASEFSTNLPDLEAKLKNAATQPSFTAEDVATGNRINQVAVAPMKTRPWRVAFFQPQAVFLEPAVTQSRIATLLSLGIAFIAVAGAVGVSYELSRPISRLTAVAEKVRGGDLSAQAAVTARDEFGVLAATFNSMTTQLRDLIASLEARVAARTAQLQASADVGRAAASILDPNQLMREVVNLISDRFGFYYAAIFTLDERGQSAVLREATGEAGRMLKERGHRLEVGGQSMVGYATAQRRARIALDVGEEAVRFANPLLPETRSEIALPLAVGDQVLGALDVQSTQGAAFDEASAALLQSMADQVAIALNNAAQFTESQLNVEALNRLLALSTDLARSRSLHDLTERALEHFEALLGTSNYYMALVDAQQTEVRFVLRRRSSEQPGDEITMRPFGNGRAEYVIRTRQPLRMSLAEAPSRLEQLGVKPWEKQSAAFLGVPILAGDRVLGMIGLQDFSPNAAFSDYHERLATALASQIAVTLENLRLAEETQRAFADLDAANRLLTGRAWERYARRSRALSGEWHAGEWLSGDGEKSKAEELHTPHALRVPVRVRGQTIGEFDILPTDLQREWTPDDVAFAQSLIDQVGQAIETARLLEETERLAGRERTINQINSRVRQMVNVDSILQAAVNELGRSLKATRVFARIGNSPEAQPVGLKPSGTHLLTLPSGLTDSDDTPPVEKGDDHV